MNSCEGRSKNVLRREGVRAVIPLDALGKRNNSQIPKLKSWLLRVDQQEVVARANNHFHYCVINFIYMVNLGLDLLLLKHFLVIALHIFVEFIRKHIIRDISLQV